MAKSFWYSILRHSTDMYGRYGNTNPYDGSGAGGYNNNAPAYSEDTSYGGAPNQRYGGRDGYGGSSSPLLHLLYLAQNLTHIQQDNPLSSSLSQKTVNNSVATRTPTPSLTSAAPSTMASTTSSASSSP